MFRDDSRTIESKFPSCDSSIGKHKHNIAALQILPEYNESGRTMFVLDTNRKGQMYDHE